MEATWADIITIKNVNWFGFRCEHIFKKDREKWSAKHVQNIILNTLFININILIENINHESHYS